MINGIAICTDPDTDSAHCGCGPDDSGMNCTALSGTASAACNAGTCAFTCLDHFADCDDDTANGCETDLNTLENCGACGTKCEDPHADKILCLAGACAYECKENTQLCEGHCRDLSEDDDNCGACGHACTDGATCQNGFCIITPDKCIDGYVTTKVNDKPIKAYCLNSELELETLRNNVNAGAIYPANNTDNAYILMKDLDLGSRDWAPIGNGSHFFTGTFLGNGKSISGNITTQGTNVGLFGTVSGAYFNHLNLHINLTAKGNHIQNKGPLAGFVYNTTLINIHEEGTIQDPEDFITNGAYPNSAYDDMGGLIGLLVNSNISNSSTKCHINFYGGGRVGGLAGMIAGSTISNCTSECDIKSMHQNYHTGIGGLVGWMLTPKWWEQYWGNNPWAVSQFNTITNATTKGTIDLTSLTNLQPESHSAGGLVGGVYSGQTISNSSSSVTIHAPKTNWSGSFLGYNANDYAPQPPTKITNSYATGDVTCKGGCGGFAGYTLNLEVSDSHATGNATALNWGGGFLGSAAGTHIKNCYATGDVLTTQDNAGGFAGDLMGNSSAENIYALGNVKTTGDFTYTGGLIGKLYDGTVNNAYAKGNVTGCHGYGGLIGEMRRGHLSNSISLSNVTPNNPSNCTSAAGIVGSLFETGISTVTNCTSTGNITGTRYIGSAVGYLSKSTATLKNVFVTGTVTGGTIANNYSNKFIGAFDNANIISTDRHGGSLAIKNSYYWSKAGGTAVVGGSTPQEPSVYGMIYQDNRAVLEDAPSVPLINALGEEWTEVTCKLSSGPGTETPDEYKIPVPKVFGANICK